MGISGYLLRKNKTYNLLRRQARCKACYRLCASQQRPLAWLPITGAACGQLLLAPNSA